MGIGYNPKTITDGLVLCFDAANFKSYPRNGTKWTDLISKNSLDLNNSPIYVTTNGGGFRFNGGAAGSGVGGGAYAQASTFENLPVGSTSRTIIVWCNPDSTQSTVYQYLAGYNQVSRTMSLGLTSGGSVFALFSGEATASISFNTGNRPTYNTCNFIAFRYDDSNPTVKYFVNVNDGRVGTATSGATQTLGTTSTNVFRVGSRFDFSENAFRGDIYMMKLYNRALSNNEIAQEYSSFRGRFGL